MQHDRQVDRVLQRSYEVIAALRRHYTGHVLYADGAHAHRGHFLCKLDILIQSVYGARGIGDSAGGHRPGLHGLLYGDLEVIRIVERVEYTDDVYAVSDGRAHEAADDIVAVMLIAEDVLPAQEHLELGVRHRRADLAQALPRILIEKAQAHVKGRAAPAFHGIEPRLVHLRQHRRKLLIRQPSRDKRLVRIPQYCFGKLYFLHVSSPDLTYNYRFCRLFCESSNSHALYHIIAQCPVIFHCQNHQLFPPFGRFLTLIFCFCYKAAGNAIKKTLNISE